MNEQDLKRRIKEFAHRCVKLAVNLPDTYLANHIKGQFIRSLTSAAANYRAVCLTQSKQTIHRSQRVNCNFYGIQENCKKKQQELSIVINK